MRIVRINVSHVLLDALNSMRLSIVFKGPGMFPVSIPFVLARVWLAVATWC